MDNPRRILIIRLDRIGDVILSTPVIANLREAYPDAHIAFMCRPAVRDVVDGNPGLDEVILYDKDGVHKSFLATLFFSLSLIKKNFDMAIILHPTNRSHWIPFLAGIPRRVGWHRKNSWLLTQRIKHDKHEGQKHESQYSLDLIRAIGVPTPIEALYFPIKDYAVLEVESILKEYKIVLNDRLILIHPVASCPSKIWPQSYFAQLAGKLMAFGKVIVVSGREDAALADELIRAAKVIDMRGRLSLAQLACLIKRSALFISNDSGPVHIAAALNVPVISIFGRNDTGLSPQRWRPLGEKSYYLHYDTGCKPCLAHNCCKNFLCLHMIKPENVFALAKKILTDIPPAENKDAQKKEG